MTVTTLEGLRIERGLSLNAVSDGTRINRKTLAYLERSGAVAPRAITIMRLAAFYGVEAPWLMAQYRKDRRAHDQAHGNEESTA